MSSTKVEKKLKLLEEFVVGLEIRVKELERRTKYMASGGKKRIECEKWLSKIMEVGSISAEEVFELAEQAGFGKILVQDVKRSLGIASVRRKGYAGWYWEL